jgi:hypothetical protein
VAADATMLAGFQSNVKPSVFIASFSFAVYVAVRITGASPRARGQRDPGGLRAGWYVRQDG